MYLAPFIANSLQHDEVMGWLKTLDNTSNVQFKTAIMYY